MLNALWLGFFLVAAVAALAQWLVGGQVGIFSAMVQALFAMARLSVEVMVLLFGTLTLWLGFLRIAEKAGVVEWLGGGRGEPEQPPEHQGNMRPKNPPVLVGLIHDDISQVRKQPPPQVRVGENPAVEHVRVSD